MLKAIKSMSRNYLDNQYILTIQTQRLSVAQKKRQLECDHIYCHKLFNYFKHSTLIATHGAVQP